ncbi:MAG TPA: SGNH/GDSL hydrolase family protein [Streptosporangiaceae bacterium]
MRMSARPGGWHGAVTRTRAWGAVLILAMALVLTFAGVAAAGGFGLSEAGSGGNQARRPDPVHFSTSGTGHGQQSAVHHPAAPATSCRSVAHIGDSTSVDLTSPVTVPDPAHRLPAQYADVGVQHLRLSASGGRSIVETLPGQVNGYDVARDWWHAGYRSCWVFALGTNDAANVAAGSAIGLTARIDKMMSVAHGEPVLWVNTTTLLSSGPWSQANERAWDHALDAALARYPNMRVLNWAAIAKPGWFLADGIHYTEVGCTARAKAIADGLAASFPLHGHSRGQIVR